MGLRNNGLIKKEQIRVKGKFAMGTMALLATALIRRWMGTLHYRCHYEDPTVDPVHANYRGAKIFIFWHENILFPLHIRGRSCTSMLLSRHWDADILDRVAGMLGFGVTGLLMELADRYLQNGGNVAVFVAELCFASLTGMAVIAASFVMARILNISSAIRLTIIGAFVGALCVVVVNGLPTITTFSSRLYWTMFCWQFLMMQFLAWLSINSRPEP